MSGIIFGVYHHRAQCSVVSKICADGIIEVHDRLVEDGGEKCGFYSPWQFPILGLLERLLHSNCMKNPLLNKVYRHVNTVFDTAYVLYGLRGEFPA